MNPSNPTPQLGRFRSYSEASARFQWSFPDRLNVAREICRRHADSVTRIALLDVKFASINAYTFGGLDYLSDKFAVVLRDHGIEQGDHVAIALPQCAEAVIAILGALKAGAAAVILGPSHSSIASGLQTCRANALVIDQQSYDRVESLPDPPSRAVFVSGHRLDADKFKDFWREITVASSDFEAAVVGVASKAFIFPNHLGHRSSALGIVHSQSSVLAQLPAFEMANEFVFNDEAMFWTPMDWSGPSVLLGILFPAWWYGCAVVSLDRALPAGWINVLEDCSVTHAFLSELHLRFLLDAGQGVGRQEVGHLRRIICTTPLESELRSRCEDGAAVSVLRGWPEAPGIIASCPRWFPTPEGWSGKAAPGFTIEVLDVKGRISNPGTLGRIAIEFPPQLAPSILKEDGRIEEMSSGLVDVGSSGIKGDDGLIWISDVI